MCSIQSSRNAQIAPVGGARCCKTPGQVFAQEALPSDVGRRILHNARFAPTDSEIYYITPHLRQSTGINRTSRALYHRQEGAEGRGRDATVGNGGRNDPPEGRDVSIERRSRNESSRKRATTGRKRKEKKKPTLDAWASVASGAP